MVFSEKTPQVLSKTNIIKRHVYVTCNGTAREFMSFAFIVEGLFGFYWT